MSNEVHANAASSESLQRQDLGVASVEAGVTISATTEEYPWISDNQEVQTALVTLEGGQQILYGSIVNGNNTLVKLASAVPSEKSRQAEIGLFKALPDLLAGNLPANIDKVSLGLGEYNLLKVAKRGGDVARLVFARTEVSGIPTIIKVGIARHKDQSQMHGIITSNKPSRRRKQDG